jgi:SAM-dependent methyltransferase
MLVLRHISLATVDQLFRYKSKGFDLPDFPGYTADQWGIKAHNRPWIEEVGEFRKNQRVLEVGGAYSGLPAFLGTKYGVEPWVADDFGATSEEPLWSRWGDPKELQTRFPTVHYVFRRLGEFAPELETDSFDRVFSVSTLEHIPSAARARVVEDMHRITKPGGLQIHTIDVSVLAPRVVLGQWLGSKFPPLRLVTRSPSNDMLGWIDLFRRSGVRIAHRVPSLLKLLDRKTLVESADVVYRFYPPNDAPKPYRPSASLLLIIEKA